MKYSLKNLWGKPASAWVNASFLILTFFSVNARASQNQPYALRLIEAARAQHLAESTAWRRLLFIPGGYFQGDTSIIDEPSFFLAPEGRGDPEAELEATLLAFAESQKAGSAGEKHARCQHPARWEFLKKKLSIREADLPKVHCQQFREYMAKFDYDQVSLVFSNYFMDNPASLFGHSFLKVHRRRDRGEEDHVLLDDVINFSAAVDDEYSLLYPLKGLAGGYWGFYALLPYHRKIQEYNNYESRDLWEFDLALTPDEMDLLQLVTWELGSTRISYYYAHQNCSYVILSLLEAAAPRLELTRQFNLYAVPSDTVRAVVLVPGLLKDVHYRPSAESRYILRLKDLSQTETQRLIAIGESQNPDAPDVWRDCDKYCQARVIDALLEFFDFKEKLAGTRIAETYGPLRQQLLRKRASLGIKSPPLSRDTVSTRVDFGHDSALIGATGGYRGDTGGFVDLNWRPALQDLSASALGYQPQMEVKFLDVTMRHTPSQHQTRLNRLDLLQITSLATDLPLISKMAWIFDAGAEAGFARTEEGRHSRSFLQLEFGKAYRSRDENWLAYTLIGPDLGLTHNSDHPWHGGAHLITGLVYQPSYRLKFLSRLDLARYWNPSLLDRDELEAIAALTLERNRDVRVRVGRRNGIVEVSLGVRQYF